MEALKFLLCMGDWGSRRCSLNTGVKDAKGYFDHSPKNGPQEEKLKSQDFVQEMMRVWTRGGSDSRQNSGRGDSEVLGEGLILYVFVCTYLHRNEG